MDEYASDEARFLEIISLQLTDLGKVMTRIERALVSRETGARVCVLHGSDCRGQQNGRGCAGLQGGAARRGGRTVRCDTAGCALAMHDLRYTPHTPAPPAVGVASEAPDDALHPPHGTCIVDSLDDVIDEVIEYLPRPMADRLRAAAGFFRPPTPMDSPPCPFSPPEPDHGFSERDGNHE